jgi:hypothetical protein
MNTPRRNFVQTTASLATWSVAQGAAPNNLAAFAAEPPPEKVRFDPEFEPIVRLMEETPRERCVPVFAEQLRRGLSYRQFLGASLFAGVRRARSNHEVYKVHAVHQVCMEARPEERLLPLFWALNVFKQRQEDFTFATMSELRGSLPPAETASEEFQEALHRGDRDRAELALAAMARAQGLRQTMEQLWPFGCRHGGAGGHMAICLANCFRALETIGWPEAEPALRFVVQDWFANGYVKPDRYYDPNQARVDKHLAHLPNGWAGQRADRNATCELHGVIRQGKADAACAAVVEQLQRGVSAQAVWDAVHLATAELLVRHQDGWGLASRPLHSNTSTNAMHFAFRTATAPATRLLVLLQAVAWAADKIGGDRASGSLRDLAITNIAAIELRASTEEAIREIFAQLPARHYRWDKARGAVLTYGSRANADEACRKAFVLARERPTAAPQFMQAARSWLCSKASNDPHEYKFLAAMFENVSWVSPEWRPHLVAAAVHYLHGDQSPDNSVIQQVRVALHAR